MGNVGVIGHWDMTHFSPLVESTLWAMVLRDFGVSEWWMSPVTGILPDQHHLVNLHERNGFHKILEEIDPSLNRIFLEPRTPHYNPVTTWLHDFEHPENCVYIFGSAHYNPSLTHLREQDTVVSIKTVQDRGVPWSCQCLMVVLYDRLMKDDSNNS